ncbi:MAG: hypothetical protein PF961_07140 [Planctomycetota bacterium]|jgi:hypothetical protein|nr:hypothetical protein [Planctomycetota bacterium]
MPSPRHAFTLFEVALSLLVMTAVVTITLMIFPTGLHGQQQARMQLFAAEAFQNVLERLRAPHSSAFGTEGAALDDRPFNSARPWQADADGVLLTRRGSYRPVPDDIAWRIDSDDDEILQHLQAGGQLYYDHGNNSTKDVVFAIIGAPQQGIVKWHPQIKWPYYDYLVYRYARGQVDANRPSQHVYAGSYTGARQLGADAIDQTKWGIGHDGAVLQHLVDRDATDGLDANFYDDATARDATRIERALATLWTELPALDLDDDGVADKIDLNADGVADLFDWDGDGTPETDYPRLVDLVFLDSAVVSMRDPAPGALPAPVYSNASQDIVADPSALSLFWICDSLYQRDDLVATAASHLLRYLAWERGQDSQDYTRTRSFKGEPYPYTTDAKVLRFQAAHRMALAMNRYLQLHHPYDLRAVRDVSHPLMTDHILIQHDLRGTPLADPNWTGSPSTNRLGQPINQVLSHSWDILTGGSIKAVRSESRSLTKNSPETWMQRNKDNNGDTSFNAISWTPSPTPLIDPGAAAMEPGRMRSALLSASDDLEQRWNLTAHFHARDRCRQFVAWQVPWMRYEDFESVPGAAVDAASYPVQVNSNRNLALWHAALGNGGQLRYAKDVAWWQNGRSERDALHPEFMSSWETDSRRSQPVLNLTSKLVVWSRKSWAGLDLVRNLSTFGSDRNGNEGFDAGDGSAVTKASRIRATTLARFTFYDPRATVPGQ